MNKGVTIELLAWLEQRLQAGEGVGGGSPLDIFLGDSPRMMFEKQEEEFHLSLRKGYGSGEFSYDFLETRPDLWMEALQRGSVKISSAFGYLGDRSVWVAVDRLGTPSRLLVTELPVEEEGLGPLLHFLLGLEGAEYEVTSSGESVRVSTSGGDLPLWLEEVLPSLLRRPSPLLLVSEAGSGAEELIQALLSRRFQEEPDPILFHPGRLSEAVQLREIFGETPAGARIGVSDVGVPMVQREGGVVVIQEAAELSSLVQLRLLGLFSSGEVRQFWIFETSRDLEAMAEVDQFQKGLYSILKKGEVVIPPVRARQEQIVLEAERLLAGFRRRYRREISLEAGARQALQEYEWPGNWRELKGSLESAFLMCSGSVIRREDLRLGESDQWDESDQLNLRKRSRELEKQLLLQAYALHGGNQVQMARALGISRGSLQYKMEKYGMIQG